MNAHPLSVGQQLNGAEALQLCWSRGPDGAPCRLNDLPKNGTSPRGISGVYLLWIADHCGSGPSWIYVGEGRDIADRLAGHLADPRVLAYTCQEIRVSWAPVASMYRQGVLCYLAKSLLPIVTEPLPAARAIPVNLPL